MHEAGSSLEDARSTELSLLKGVELGVGNSLGDVLLAHRAIRDALERLSGVLGGLANSGGRASKLNSQQAGVGVSEVGGRDGEASRPGGGLGEQAEARSPLDRGLATQQSSEDGNLGLRAVAVGAGEGDDHGVATSVVRPLLAAVVLGRLNLEGLAALRAGRDVLEELANPLGQGVGRRTVGDDSNVGLGVDDVGVASNVLLVQVLLGSRQRRVYGGAEAGVEGDGVGVVEGQSGHIGVESSLLEVQDTLNILVELVRCN